VVRYSSDKREATYYRYWMHLVHHDVPAHFGVRTDDHKLIYYYSEHYKPEKYGTPTMTWMPESFPIESTPKAWELYDLKKDPEELVNRYDDPDYQNVVADLKAKLINMREELQEGDEAFPQLKEVIDTHWE
jgi:arylsulfatase A-like enzyme